MPERFLLAHDLHLDTPRTAFLKAVGEVSRYQLNVKGPGLKPQGLLHFWYITSLNHTALSISVSGDLFASFRMRYFA